MNMFGKGILSIQHTFTDILEDIVEHLVNDVAPTDSFILGFEIIFLIAYLIGIICLIRYIIKWIREKSGR